MPTEMNMQSANKHDFREPFQDYSSVLTGARQVGRPEMYNYSSPSQMKYPGRTQPPTCLCPSRPVFLGSGGVLTLGVGQGPQASLRTREVLISAATLPQDFLRSVQTVLHQLALLPILS